MGETCERCGRRAATHEHEYGDVCTHVNGPSCKTHQDAYQRGRRDGIAHATPQWQPMDTAPRDGTEFIGALGRNHYKLAAFECYEDSEGMLVEHFVCDGAGHSLDLIAWMPLPRWTENKDED